MKTLKSTIKKKWSDMIESGEKREEYKAVSVFWISRLCENVRPIDFQHDFEFEKQRFNSGDTRKHYDAFQYFNGPALSPKYPNNTVAIKSIRIGEGRPEWGAEPGKEYFVIELGEAV